MEASPNEAGLGFESRQPAFCHCFRVWVHDVGGCQNYGPLLGTLNIRCRTILRTQKGTLMLTTTHMGVSPYLGGLIWAFR